MRSLSKSSIRSMIICSNIRYKYKVLIGSEVLFLRLIGKVSKKLKVLYWVFYFIVVVFLCRRSQYTEVLFLWIFFIDNFVVRALVNISIGKKNRSFREIKPPYYYCYYYTCFPLAKNWSLGQIHCLRDTLHQATA